MSIEKRKKIVVIGGGTGTYTVLIGIKKYPVNITAVVAMADDGGSTKLLREEFKVLPPGSVRPALIALSNAEKYVSDLFHFRFENGEGLKGHNFGNLFITALTKQAGSFEKAIEVAGKILNIQGEVVPSTLDDCVLRARLSNGRVIEGEANIDEPKHDATMKIEEVTLKTPCKANPKALQALEEANVIVIGPGDLYSSIVPNFLVDGIAEAIQKSKAKKVYVCNLMTKYGETNNFTANDFVDIIEKYLGSGVLSHVIVNTQKPDEERVEKYEKEHAQFVEYDAKELKSKRIKVIEEKLLRPVGSIRHDSDTLARIICKL